MPNACFVDTNVLLYLIDPTLQVKQKQARGWLDALARRDLAVISPQVLNEFAHNVIRKFSHIDHETLLSRLDAIRPWCLAPLTAETASQAVVIHWRFRFSFYDCTLIASALSYGCDMFLSEDLTHHQRIGELVIVNPFRTDPRSIFES